MESEKHSNEELVAAIQAGNREKLEELWTQVERFVMDMARKRMNRAKDNGIRGIEFEDLCQSGYLALVSAVETYAPTQEVAFVTYLWYGLVRAFDRAENPCRAKKDNNLFNYALSLDVPVGENEDAGTLVDFIPGTDSDLEESVLEGMYLRQLHDTLELAMQELPSIQSYILHRRYYNNETQKSIAATLHCSASNVGVYERAALKHLYRARMHNGLSEFIETHTNYYEKVGRKSFQNTGTSAVESIVLKRERLAQQWLKARRFKKGDSKA